MEHSKYVHDYIRIYDFGKKSQIVYFKTPRARDQSARDSGTGEFEATGERLSNNIARARSRVRELALCNDWQFFVTLTLDKEKYDRYNLKAFQNDLTQWVRNQRRLKGCSFEYLFIPEQHKDGAWHIHGLVSGLSDTNYREFSLDEVLPEKIRAVLKKGEKIFELPQLSKKFGWTTATPIKNAEACANYVVKYISKDAEATATAMAAGDHLYYASRGLRGKELLYSGPVADASAIPWAFENEYCKILWTDNLNALRLDPTFERSKNA